MQLVIDDRNLPVFRVTFPTGVRYLFRQDLDIGMYVFNLNDVSRNLRYSFLSIAKEKNVNLPVVRCLPRTRHVVSNMR